MMAVARTDRLLQALEAAAASEAEAAEALYALLHATRAVPITFAQRTRAEALLRSRLLLPPPRGLLGPEHPLVKLLALRLSTHYLPGVSEFPLPPPPAHAHAHAHAGKASAATDAAATGEEGIPRSPALLNGGSGSSSGGGLLSFLFQPLPRGAKAMCTVTRSSTRLKPVYRLQLEQLLVPAPGDEDVERHLRTALQAAGLDPRWVVGPSSSALSSGVGEEALWGGGGGDVGAASPALQPPAGALEAGGRCLLEARRLKAPAVAKTVQVAVYAHIGIPSHSSSSSSSTGATGRRAGGGGGSKGERRQVGQLQSPAPGVLTATATATTTDAGAAAAPAPAAASVVGTRLCVQVCERKRLLSLSVALPAAPGKGNVPPGIHAEVLEVPTAHLKALCGGGGSSGSPVAVFGARSRPPRWSALNKLHTLDFECGARRVREPSRKNLALLDAAHLPPAALAAHHRGGASSSSSGGGGGGIVIGRGLPRIGPGGAGGGMVAAMMGEEAAWSSAGAAAGAGAASRERGARPVLQLGKLRDNQFSLDFRAPFSPFQALAVAIAAFEA